MRAGMVQGMTTAQAAQAARAAKSATGTPQTKNAFAAAMAGAQASWPGGTGFMPGLAAAAAAVSGTQPVQGADTVSAWGRTDEVSGATLEEMLQSVHPQLSYHVMDCSSSNWLRNDYPHYKLFEKNVSAKEIENWRPTGDEPTQAQSPACHAASRVAPGSVAVVIHPAVQEKMDADPEYAKEIFNRIEAWFAFDEARNAAIAASHGDVGSGIDKRAIAIGEDGLIANAYAAGSGRLTVSSSGSTRSRRPSAYEARLARHDALMREIVQEQIEHNMFMSDALNAASFAASARSKVTAMMADPALRAALGDTIRGVPLDTVFAISLQHIDRTAPGSI